MSEIGGKNTENEDINLIRSILAGKKDDFVHLEKKYRSLIKFLIRKMVKDEDDVDDLMQETFIKAYNALPGFQFEYTFSSWIYRIASNTCIDFMRKKRFVTVSLNAKPGDEDDSELEIVDSEPTPDNDMINRERTKLLETVIENLPPNYRDVILLRHREEMDYQEIADKLGIPLGTVKAHLFRARKIMYDVLSKNRDMLNRD